jgi:DNA-binding winged helix-turn-helix (wHTH) protein
LDPLSDEKLHVFGDYALDLKRGCLLRGGEAVHLRPQSYEVLKYLAENPGRLISKDRLIEEVWRGRAVTGSSPHGCPDQSKSSRWLCCHS